MKIASPREPEDNNTKSGSSTQTEEQSVGVTQEFHAPLGFLLKDLKPGGKVTIEQGSDNTTMAMLQGALAQAGLLGGQREFFPVDRQQITEKEETAYQFDMPPTKVPFPEPPKPTTKESPRQAPGTIEPDADISPTPEKKRRAPKKRTILALSALALIAVFTLDNPIKDELNNLVQSEASAANSLQGNGPAIELDDAVINEKLAVFTLDPLNVLKVKEPVIIKTRVGVVTTINTNTSVWYGAEYFTGLNTKTTLNCTVVPGNIVIKDAINGKANVKLVDLQCSLSKYDPIGSQAENVNSDTENLIDDTDQQKLQQTVTSSDEKTALALVKGVAASAAHEFTTQNESLMKESLSKTLTRAFNAQNGTNIEVIVDSVSYGVPVDLKAANDLLASVGVVIDNNPGKQETGAVLIPQTLTEDGEEVDVNKLFELYPDTQEESEQ